MTLEMLLDFRSVVKVDLNLPLFVQAFQNSVLKKANARSTPATEAQMRDILLRIDPRSAEYLKTIARNADGTMAWKDMRPIFGIDKAEDWHAYSGPFGKGLTRAYRRIFGDHTAKLVWWNDATGRKWIGKTRCLQPSLMARLSKRFVPRQAALLQHKQARRA